MKLYFPPTGGNSSYTAFMKYQGFLIALVQINAHRKALENISLNWPLYVQKWTRKHETPGQTVS